MMKRCFYLLLLIMVTAADGIQAQVRQSGAATHTVRSYLDSLQALRSMTDTIAPIQEHKDGLSAVENYMMFSPFTYYHAPISRMLQGSDSVPTISEDVARKLLQMYLEYPNLVVGNETSLGDAQGSAGSIDKPLPSDGSLVDKVEQSILEPGSEPVEVMIHKPNFWTIKGDYYLQFLQNYISDNWYKGGESTYSALGSITMEANYNNKQKVKWDNKLELKLGFLHSRSDSLHSIKTSEDLIRYTGKVGLQATKRWYYTFQALAYTQFYRGFKSNDPMVYSSFFAPFNLNLSLGMDYNVEAFNKRLTGTIHLAPIAYNFRYVRRPELATRYGLKEGKRMLHDKGSQFTVDLEWKFSETIGWKTRLYGFTTYKKAEFEWENTFTFKFNRYISSNLFVYPRFDDGVARGRHHGYWQIKEFLSIGFSYSF